MTAVESRYDVVKFQYRPTRCAICDTDDEKLLYKITTFQEGDLNFVRCNHCGLVYQNPRPTEDSLRQFFTSTSFVSHKETKEGKELTGYYDYLGDESFRLKMAKGRLKQINRIFNQKKPLDILKIAPGTGTFLKLAKDQGHHITGVDVSEFFVDYARQHYGIDMILSTFEDVDLGDRKFDVVAWWGSIANLNDPPLCLEKIHRHLKDDGILMVNYQNFESLLPRIQKSKYFLFRPPVLNFFSKKNIIQLMDKKGFRVVSHKLEWQYTNLGKLSYFSRVKLFRKIVDALKVHYLVFKMPVPGTHMMILKKKDKA